MGRLTRPGKLEIRMKFNLGNLVRGDYLGATDMVMNTGGSI
jgi:hypothetical protein